MDSNTALMALITGALLPFVTGALTKASWASWVKFIVVVVTAIVIAVIELALTGQLDGITLQTAYSYLGAVYITSGVVFWLLIDTTGLRPWLEGIFLKDKE